MHIVWNDYVCLNDTEAYILLRQLTINNKWTNIVFPSFEGLVRLRNAHPDQVCAVQHKAHSRLTEATQRESKFLKRNLFSRRDSGYRMIVVLRHRRNVTRSLRKMFFHFSMWINHIWTISWYSTLRHHLGALRLWSGRWKCFVRIHSISNFMWKGVSLTLKLGSIRYITLR